MIGRSRLQPLLLRKLPSLHARANSILVNVECSGMNISFPDVLPHWVGGKKVFPNPGTKLMPKVYPATSEVICKVPVADEGFVDYAVEIAREGFKVWSRMSGNERGRILANAGKMLLDAHPELARLEVLDTGKPLSESVSDTSGADSVQFFSGLASTVCVSGSYIPLGSKAFGYTRREPLGVCVGIGAWNYPNQIALWKSAPALACGNSVILKPSELTPLTALRIAEIYSEAGVPPGVFNVVHGDHTTGSLLAGHKGVRKVSLTGSVPTGKKIMERAATTLKTISLELGGKSPMIVFNDANIDNAVRGAMMANFYCQGEVCSNGTRLLVQESIKDDFMHRFCELTNRIRIGDPMKESTQFGALITENHMKKVRSYIDEAKSQGCHPVLDRSVVTDLHSSIRNGFFLGPVIFEKCTKDSRLLKEEIFGPVACVQTFKTEEEAIEMANGTDFGLAAAVFTNDIQRAHRVVDQLDAGTCWINEYNLSPPELPFGGRKESGFGKEGGVEAVSYYSQIKSVYVAMSNVWCPYDE
uniref:Aldehyde dehydrogenase domain-containing protein n=1 Tax=Guillardia theta TaxID=55529 RepID=A0A7S4U7E9_GUITH|mmetsp:Transcript_48354/g.151629  ORF Transcript_48354/g.151629 Transcript_48354/m.151629 type:complete len:529 (+) Transcript_48354:86-1672(+)